MSARHPEHLDLTVGGQRVTSSLSHDSHPSVALPHKNPTKSFWTHGSDNANPLAKEGSDGPLTKDADVVIIGSGITGIGTAYYLSEAIATTDLSLNIVVFEARDFCEIILCTLLHLVTLDLLMLGSGATGMHLLIVLPSFIETT